MRLSPVPLLLVMLATLAPGARSAPPPLDGWYLEEETLQIRAGGAEHRDVARTWLVDGAMRKEEGATGTVTLFDDVAGRVTVIDSRARTYFELSREVLDEMGRMSMTELMPDAGNDPSEWLVRTGETRRIGAWQAYEVRVVDRPIPGARLSIWLSEDLPTDARLRSRFSGAVLGGANPAAKLLQGLRSLPGYPVELDLHLRLGAQEMRLVQRLLKLEQRSVAAEQFRVPAGFQKVLSPVEQPPPAPPAPEQ